VGSVVASGNAFVEVIPITRVDSSSTPNIDHASYVFPRSDGTETSYTRLQRDCRLVEIAPHHTKKKLDEEFSVRSHLC